MTLQSVNPHLLTDLGPCLASCFWVHSNGWAFQGHFISSEWLLPSLCCLPSTPLPESPAALPPCSWSPWSTNWPTRVLPSSELTDLFILPFSVALDTPHNNLYSCLFPCIMMEAFVALWCFIMCDSSKIWAQTAPCLQLVSVGWQILWIPWRY